MIYLKKSLLLTTFLSVFLCLMAFGSFLVTNDILLLKRRGTFLSKIVF